MKDLFNLDAVLESVSENFIREEGGAVLSESVMYAIEESVNEGNEHILFESVAFETSLAVLEAKAEKEEESEDDDEDDEEEDDEEEDKEEGEGAVDEAYLNFLLESENGGAGAAAGEAKKEGGMKARLEKIGKILKDSWDKLVAFFNNILDKIKATIYEKLNSYERFISDSNNNAAVLKGLAKPGAKELKLINMYNFSNLPKVATTPVTAERFVLEVINYVGKKGANLVGFDRIATLTIGEKEEALINLGLDEITQAAVKAITKKLYGEESTDVRAAVRDFAKGQQISVLADMRAQELILGLKGTKPMMEQFKQAKSSIDKAKSEAQKAAKGIIKNKDLDGKIIEYAKKVDAIYRIGYTFELNQRLGLLDAIKSRGYNFYVMAKSAAKLSGMKVTPAAGDTGKTETKQEAASESTLVNEFMEMLA